MPQALLPLISEDATRISDLMNVVRQDGQWFYFCGTQPVFQHDESDLRSFRMFTAQLCVQGACKQAEIIKAFGVSKSSVPRSVNKYLEEGIEGFYRPRRARGAPVMMGIACTRPIDHGILEAIENDVVPRLLTDVPGQPTKEELEADPYRSRFLMIFDREGYSPSFFQRMWQEHRIACVTYHKFPKKDWPTSEFSEVTATRPRGEVVTMKLAERGSLVGAQDSMWMREVRKLTSSGHQASRISTAYGREGSQDAVALFSRWGQENFFRYMMEQTQF